MRDAFHLPPGDTTNLRDGTLLLRPLLPDDVDALWIAGQSEDIGLYTSIEWPFTQEAARRLIVDATATWNDATAARFAILDEVNGHPPMLAGTASLLHIYPDRLDAEVGYWIGSAGRGRRMAHRAVRLLCDWAFAALGLRCLHLGVDIPNMASHAVARSNGFTPTGEEMWRHPTDPSKDAVILMYERFAPHHVAPRAQRDAGD
ncbi:MAG TPA: GNAT family N-acetyltransferase [Thermomicrobiales bacterium]|nr:GNAT family N-acetyltransferase [Thermomicrobiales bacterium]